LSDDRAMIGADLLYILRLREHTDNLLRSANCLPLSYRTAEDGRGMKN
jgi:hypothetical protein